MSDYELKIISSDEISNGKVLKKYNIDGVDTIGIYENETFTISFKNNTWNKIQVKISIDGLYILNGKLANTNIDDDMFVCQPYGTLELKAFPETNKGGAEFTFCNTEDSVVVNTCDVKTGIGYIAAAIFTDNVQSWINFPVTTNINIPTQEVQWFNTYTSPNTKSFTYGGSYGSGSMTVNSSNTMNVYSAQLLGDYGQSVKSLESITTTASCGPAVGAGEYVNQEITKVAGLNKPILATTISIKYEWWVSLRSKVRALKEKPINPAFPGDQQVEKMIDLKSTPRKKKNKNTNNEVKYPELNRFG